MSAPYTSIAATLLVPLLWSLPNLAEAAPCASRVQVNGRCVPEATIAQLAATYGRRAEPGRYWYDRRSGLLGRIGEPPLGQLAPNLPLPGRLGRRASRGDTGVLVNGRELHRLEVQEIAKLGPVRPGRYWMDAAGNVGIEGSPQPFANLFAAFKQRRDRFRRNWLLDTTFNSDGRCSYVSTDSGTVMTGDCN